MGSSGPNLFKVPQCLILLKYLTSIFSFWTKNWYCFDVATFFFLNLRCTYSLVVGGWVGSEKEPCKPITNTMGKGECGIYHKRERNDIVYIEEDISSGLH